MGEFNKKDIELRREFFVSLKKQYLKGAISKEEFDNYILSELQIFDNINSNNFLEVSFSNFFHSKDDNDKE